MTDMNGAKVSAAKSGKRRLRAAFIPVVLLLASPAAAADIQSASLASASLDFTLFALTLIGIGLFHRRSLQVALMGLAAVTAEKLLWTGFKEGPGLSGLFAHIGHEWVVLANLFLLLNGFAILARHFEKSRVPDWMPAALPDDWKGGFLLLVLVFIMSSFLDNIAAALIGVTVASHIFKGRVRVGYVAAVVAAANAGGAGSVIGDTTTTMLWIGGVSPASVVKAYIAAVTALLVCGIPASLAQHAHSPIVKDPPRELRLSYEYLIAVGIILGAAIATNVGVNLAAPEMLNDVPLLGIAVALAIVLCLPLARPDWRVLPSSLRNSVFLLSLVAIASMMPVERMPHPTWHTTLGLGFVSAVFDNIPLTALALRQNGYDWDFLAYAVGFGGSMIWFGSSAGVAVVAMKPEAKSTSRWLAEGWPVILAYVVGFVVMLAVLGWNPDRHT